jgi:Polyketide cyclase / dehydrase and lipid transport
MSRVVTETVTVTAAPDQVFEVLTDPARHSEFDATGMVGLPATSARLTHVGQIFVMNMTYREGDYIEHYQSDNHVCALEPGRAIAWATATHRGAPLGWLWRYDVKPVAEGAAVTLTYDWTGTPPENVRRFGVPLADADGLARSLQLLARACGAACAGQAATAADHERSRGDHGPG